MVHCDLDATEKILANEKLLFLDLDTLPRRAELTNLNSKPEFNGTECLVQGYDEEKQKYFCHTDFDDKDKWLPRDKLVCLASRSLDQLSSCLRLPFIATQTEK